MKTSIPLRRAYAKRSRKRLGYLPNREYSKLDHVTGVSKRVLQPATVHTFPAQASIVRVGEDEIVVTDGSWGYIPFKLSELQLMLREAKRLPIANEFRTDVTP